MYPSQVPQHSELKNVGWMSFVQIVTYPYPFLANVLMFRRTISSVMMSFANVVGDILDLARRIQTGLAKTISSLVEIKRFTLGK